jgi:hypothetical protein
MVRSVLNRVSSGCRFLLGISEATTSSHGRSLVLCAILTLVMGLSHSSGARKLLFREGNPAVQEVFSGGYLRQNPGFKYKYTSYERKTQKDEKKSASLKAART